MFSDNRSYSSSTSCSSGVRSSFGVDERRAVVGSEASIFTDWEVERVVRIYQSIR